MITGNVKLTGGWAGFGQGSDQLFRRNQMLKLGDFALKTLKARVARGIGSDDAPMPPLKVSARAGIQFKLHGQQRTLLSYAQWKANHGLQPIRDFHGSGKQGGHMMDNLTVRSASDNSVRMDFTQQRARVKARANEQRTPALSFSDMDQQAIVEYAQELFEQEVQLLAESITKGRNRR